MNAEPVMDQDTFPTEPTHRWADDGGVLTEERQPEPESMEPLLSDEAEQAFLSRWAEIQAGFVEDPAQSVREADRLINEIAAALQSSFQARRTDLAADWQDGSPGTEGLRMALRRYRAFIGVILPK